MTAEEFFKYDQDTIESKHCSTDGVREYDYEEPNDIPYSKEEMIAFAEAYHQQRLKLIIEKVKSMTVLDSIEDYNEYTSGAIDMKADILTTLRFFKQ